MWSRLIGRSVVLCLAVAALAPAQQFTYTYVLPTNLNTIPLHPGDTITFPPTPPNSVAQALLNITNSSALPGEIDNIATSGSAFALAGLPVFPVTVSGNQTLQVLLRYQPSGATQDGGNVTRGVPGWIASHVQSRGVV